MLADQEVLEISNQTFIKQKSKLNIKFFNNLPGGPRGPGLPLLQDPQFWVGQRVSQGAGAAAQGVSHGDSHGPTNE
jgi:hypothetical protein